jgi:hypothetical protein
MKQLTLIFLFIFVLQAEIYGESSEFLEDTSGNISENSYFTEAPYRNPSCLCDIDFCSLFDSTVVEARVSYFGFFSRKLRQMFDNGGANYTINVAIPVYCGWNIWGAVDYFTKHGNIIHLDASTRITIVPLTLGLKYFYSFSPCIDVYGGLGMRYFFVQTKNSASASPLSRRVNRSGLGGVLEVGALYHLTDCFVIDVFANASTKRLNGPRTSGDVESNSVQVGGWSIGAGLGYKF